MGLGKYYQLKSSDIGYIKPELNQEINIEKFATKNSDNSYEIFVNIQGIHCGACIWLIETILKKDPNVISSRINLTQKTLFLKWRNKLDNFYQIIDNITKIGYKILPIDKEIIAQNQNQQDKSLLLSLAIAGFGAGNLMLLSFGLWFSSHYDMGFYTRNLLHFFSAIIAIPVIIYAGRPFFRSAIKSIKAGYPNMDLVISVAIILTTIASLIKTFKGDWHIYFDSAVMLIFFLLIGKYLEQKIRRKAFNIANEFMMLNSNYGRVLINNKIQTLPTSQLKKDMILIIASGEKISADGIIIEGESEIDNSLINGESKPKLAKINDNVYAGTINLGSPIKVLITKNQSDSILSQIIKLTQKIDNNKNKYIKISDKLAKLYIPISHLLAFLTFIIWYCHKNNLDQAFNNAIAVLIITCPCALALAIPIVQTILTSKMLKKGIIIKSGNIIEQLPKIDTIIFDKTGTLTQGKPVLQDIFEIKNNKLVNLSKQKKDKLLKIAASLCQNSRHPIAQSILNEYKGNFYNIKTIEIKGQGLKAKLKNDQIFLGKAEFCKINDKLYQDLDKKGNLNSYLRYQNSQLLFIFDDQLKDDAKKIIKILQKNKKVILLSGDNEENVKKISKSLKINRFYYDHDPVKKADFLKTLPKDEKFIMVGDGINDALSLQMADISISFNNASDIAQSISDIIIQGDKLNPISQIISSSTKSVKIMKQNLSLSLLYNIIAVPFAMAGFIIPLFAALAMSSSSIIVTLNSLRTK
jgi:P-type Cu2+ transporter